MTLLFLLATAAVPAAEAAAANRKVCVRQAVMRDSPRGFVVAYLRRGTVVQFVRRSANRRSVAIRTRSGLIGWVSSGALCRA